MLNPTRTPEGWLIIDSQYKNDDPHQLDGCWHRGPYWRHTLRGTTLSVEGDAYNFGNVDALDKLLAVVAAHFPGETYEQVIDGPHKPCYRVLRTVA